MTKSDFRKHIIISSLLATIMIAGIIAFCVIMFDRYQKPNQENTSIEIGTVSDVYYASGKDVVIVEMSNEEKYKLVCPWSQKDLYNSIGYDLDQLAELLEGQTVEYRKMDKLPWIVEIHINDVVIDNNEMTCEQIDTTYVGIVIVGLIMLAFPICGEIAYIKTKYKIYKKAEKKRIKKARRNEK